MRSLWTLRRSLDVWSVAIKTWHVEPETIMQVKLISPLSPAKRKKKKKTQTQQIKTPSFLPANSSDILKGNITKNFSLLLLCYLSSLLYLFFIRFMEVSPWLSIFKVAKVEFYGGHRTELSIFLWKTHLWGKTWPSQWPISALMKYPDNDNDLSPSTGLNHCLNVFNWQQ